MTQNTDNDAILDPRTGQAVQPRESETIDDAQVIGEEDDEEIDDEIDDEEELERPFVPFSEETNSISDPDLEQADEEDEDENLDRNI